MKVVYISSPYSSGDVGANVREQVLAAHRIMDLGHCPVAPLLSHYLHLYRPRPYGDWMAVDLAIIPKMDAVIRLPGISPGAEKETDLARAHGIPVFQTWQDLKDYLLLS